jgi:outer membrane protein TolC
LKKTFFIRYIEFSFALLAFVILFAGCQSTDEYRNQRAELAIKHFEMFKLKTIPAGKVFTLPECITNALKHNLDLKVYDLEEMIARENKTAEMLGMLPDMNISYDATARSNTPASSSRKLSGDGATYGASQGRDKNTGEFRIEMMLSVLDFGLAFINSAQAKDRTIVREQQTIRAAQNLSLQVVKTYFKVAAAQRAIHITTDLLQRCRSRSELLNSIAQRHILSPFRLFDEHKRFVNLEKRLTAYIRSYENACVELRALMGYFPNRDIKVDEGALVQLRKIKLPDISLMEKIALMQRSELYQLDINRHITVNEARKTILMMMPNVRIFVNFNQSSNAFLYYQSWWEIGARAAYNLLKLPQQISRYKSLEQQVDANMLRTMALSIGIISQVRIAHANIIETEGRYDINKKVYDTYSKNLKYAKANIQTTGALSKLELDRIELETAETKIDCIISLSQYYVAYYQLLNMIGVKNLGQKNLDYMIKKIKAAEARIAKEEMAPLEASEKGQAVKSETVKERKNEKTIDKDKV